MYVLHQYVLFNCKEQLLAIGKKPLLAQDILLFSLENYLRRYAEYLLAQEIYLGAKEKHQPAPEKSKPAEEIYLLANEIYLSLEEIYLSTQEIHLPSTAIYLPPLEKYLLAAEKSREYTAQATKWHSNTPYLSSNNSSQTRNEPMIGGKKACCRAPPKRAGPCLQPTKTQAHFFKQKQQFKNKYYGNI